MIKKIYIAALASLIFATGLTPAFAADTNWYKDVPTTHWAYEKIEFATQKSIITGYPDNTFKPEGMVTCEEAISMLYFTLASIGELKDDLDYSEKYKDILDEAKIASWSRKVVSYALEYEIITDDDVQTFISKSGSGRPALREETAIWSAKAIGDPTSGAYTLGYLDTEAISPEAVEYVDLLYRLKIMTGDNHNRFLPKNNVKRCEFASVCMSIYESRQMQGFVLSRDVVNVSGVVTAVLPVQSRLTLKTPEADLKYITIPSQPELFYDITVGSSMVIGYCTFDEDCGISVQILGKDPSAYVLDRRVQEIKPYYSTGDGKNYFSISLSDNMGRSIIYLIDEKTSIFDSAGNTVAAGQLASGDEVKVICDGVKIMELMAK